MAFGKLIFEPQIVMFFGPVEVDLAGPHGLERALHSKRADIDVTEDQGDEQGSLLKELSVAHIPLQSDAIHRCHQA